MKDKWRILAGKIQGAAHKRKNVVCQDNFLTKVLDNGLIIAVADGHGSKNHFRSDKGSFLACRTAVDIAEKYIENVFIKENISVVEDICGHKFKVDILAEWQRGVLGDFKTSPLSEEELSILNISKENYDNIVYGGNQYDSNDYYKLLSAYGSTLLIAVLMEDFLFFWQLGDGDILLYYEQDSKILNPVPPDERLIANETTSLCQKDAVSDMRFSKKYLYDRKNEPDVLMITTDGYSNSFANHEDFQKVLMDYYEMLGDNPEEVSGNIENWLDETSEKGSGDDISLVLVWKNH